METTKKLNETPLIQQMTDKHTYIIVDDQGNVSRVKDVAKEYVTETELETELNTFIEPYNERITANETNISNMKTDVETNVSDIEEYLDNLTPKSTAKSNLVHITDALGLHTFGTKAAGQVRQVTTTGKQLFNYKDTITMVTHTVDEDDWITIAADNTNGTAEIYKNLFTNKSDLLKENTNYKCVLEIKNISQSDKTKGSYINMLGVETVTQFQKAKTIKLNELSIGTFVYDALTKESFEETSMMARNFIAISIGDSVSITFRLSVIEDTTVTPETFVYEKYTGGQVSPNPSYPQDIEVLEAYNLFDKDNYILDTWDNNFDAFQVDLKAGTYTLSCNSTMSTIKASDHIGTSWDSAPFGTAEKLKIFTFTISEDYKGGIVIRLDGGVQINHTNISNYDIRLTKGTKEKPYLPYGHIGYKVNGKNILNFNVTQILNVINNSDGTITLNGKGNGNLWYSPIVFKANKKYYIKVELVSGEITGINDSGIMNPSASTFLPLNKFNEFSFTEDTYRQTMWTHANAVYNNARLKIWISDEQTDYEPYKEQIVPLDLKGNWVGKINDDIKDYLVTDKKKYWLV